VFPLIPITPDPVLFQFGPLAIGWYGIGYIVGLGVLLLVTQAEVARRGINPQHVWAAFLLVFLLAVAGGRLYHVIDQWGPVYSRDPIRAILPISETGQVGFAGLGLYGGIAGAALGIFIYARRHKLPLRITLDSVIPGTLFAQGIARWGNFFNQELYGPPTDAPWGIAIECAYRVAQYPCSTFPEATTGFHPLFFYESALNITGGLLALFLSRRYLHRLQPGDLIAFWAIWYGSTRFVLEFFRQGWNWTVGGIATAQLVGIFLIALGVAILAWNHRRGRTPYEYPPPWSPGSDGTLVTKASVGPDAERPSSA
jgi:phosphatidylglycerol---prolipoprotein diacylglyceryl transferase